MENFSRTGNPQFKTNLQSNLKLTGNLKDFKSTFGDYDIRGQVSENFSENHAYLIGRAFASVAQCKGVNTIAVGYDRRNSSVQFNEAYIKGLLDSGSNVIDLGRMSTAYTSLSYNFTNADASTMITASHNPSNYNGFKFHLKGKNFFCQQLLEVYDRIVSSSFQEGSGKYHKENFINEYLHFLFNQLSIHDVKAIWDAGHGAAGDILPHIKRQLPEHNIFLREDVDEHASGFDNTKPEFIKSTCEVLKNNPDYIAFVFDGDADRLVVIDEDQHVWSGDELLTIFSLFTKINSDSQITTIWDSKASKTLTKFVSEFDINTILSKTGHCYVIDAIKKNHAKLGGEISGHYMFNDDFFCVDDAIYGALKIMHILQHLPYKLCDLKKIIPTVWASKPFRIHCRDMNKYDVMEHIKTSLIMQNKMIEIVHDSIIINHTNGWWLIRPSQTENVISARCEGWNKESYEEVKDFMEAILSSCGLMI